jgi:hypothetical protein
MIQTLTQASPVEAFCETCPNNTHVTQQLARLGVHLRFQLPASMYPPSNGGGSPIIQPAQYHYVDTHGTEVIYLAGRDRAEEGESPLPPHASRWWIYPGRNDDATTCVKQALSSCWFLTWTPYEER